MKDLKWIIALRIMIPIFCLVIAGLIAIKGHDGWGWFLFAAILTSDITIKTKGGKDNIN